VLVGGLGLGHTAEAALAFENVNRLDVVESLEKIGNGWKCSPRRKVISALADHYAVRLPLIFEETPVDHAGEQLGKTTGFGAITQKKHMDKVGSLVSSVK
jgi:hypothetical protein